MRESTSNGDKNNLMGMSANAMRIAERVGLLVKYWLFCSLSVGGHKADK